MTLIEAIVLLIIVVAFGIWSSTRKR